MLALGVLLTLRSITPIQRLLLLGVSLAIVALGQPAWVPPLAVVTAFGGYALCWWALLSIENTKQRCWTALVWFSAVQLFQLSWLASHPYSYIYAVQFGLSVLMGMQYAVLAAFITPERMERWQGVVLVASAWTLLEWVRLFFLAGLTFNPAGLALTATIPSLQAASLLGTFGLTFWVMLCNGVTLQVVAFRHGSLWPRAVVAVACAAAPYVYGAVVLASETPEEKEERLSVLLVDTSFPPEEMTTRDLRSFIVIAYSEWTHILDTIAAASRDHDLVVMPEGVVPLGSKYPFYEHADVVAAFRSSFGDEVMNCLPRLEAPLAQRVPAPGGERWLVSNGYWAQAIANIVNADVVVGLEGEATVGGKQKSTNAALYYQPGVSSTERGYTHSYAKRVLLPMAEYIPYEWLKRLAAKYGIADSFAQGQQANLFPCGSFDLGLSVCYEETFGHLTRESRLAGAEMIVNITNDVWYPRSKLAAQHFDLARLRTVELGIPLVRSCNFGISAAIDSYGRVIAATPDGQWTDWTSRALEVEVTPTVRWTPYVLFGDYAILAVAGLGLCVGISRRRI